MHHNQHVAAMQQEENYKNCFKVCVFGEQHVGKSMLVGILHEMLPVIHINNNVENVNTRNSLGGLSREDMMLKVDSRANIQQMKPFPTSSCTINVAEFPSLDSDLIPSEQAKLNNQTLFYTKVQIYEVSTRPIHLRLLEHTACGADLFIFVFDLSVVDSLDGLLAIIQQASVRTLITDFNVPVVLVGNKLDLQPKRVEQEKVYEFQQQLINTYQMNTTYFEISCLRCNFAVLRLLNHVLVMAQPTALNVAKNNQLNASLKTGQTNADTKKKKSKTEDKRDELDLAKLLEQIALMQKNSGTESELPTVRSVAEELTSRTQIPNLPRKINNKNYDDGYERAFLYD